jgi:hypothetical protein
MVGGSGRRLVERKDVERLRDVLRVVTQWELVAARQSEGILYVEGSTDLNLLREWARVVEHPASVWFQRRPLWRGKKAPGRDDASEVDVRSHFDSLCLVRPDLTAVWLVDGDGKLRQRDFDSKPRPGQLNRIAFARYEAESYLIHPAALVRFVMTKSGNGPAAVEAAVRAGFKKLLGVDEIVDRFWRTPFALPPIVEGYFKSTKARTTILGTIFDEAGIHGLDYTDFDQIAAQMLPEEIHPEIIAKLDFIQQAFKL